MRTLGAATISLVLVVAATACENPFYTGPDWEIETVYLPAVHVTGETPEDCCDHRVEWVSNDPRLSGRVTTRGNGRTFPPDWEATFGAPPVAGVSAGTYTIVNDAGRWVGTSTGLSLGAPETISLETVVLTGEGAYEGLTAYLLVEEDEDCEDACPTFEGLLFPGPMPASPPLGGGAVLAADPGEPVLAAPEPATGPLGRSYADWAASYMGWRFQVAEDVDTGGAVEQPGGPGGPADCEAGDFGDVLFAPTVASTDPIECSVAADQRILLVVTFPCPRDEDPVGCFSGAEFGDVFVSVDGQELAIDDSFFQSGSYEGEGYPGYYMMLEPLAPGEHAVEWGGAVEFGRGAGADDVQHAITVQVEEPSWG